MMAILRVLASNFPIRHISSHIWLWVCFFFNIKAASSPVKRMELRVNIAVPSVKIL